MNGKMVDGRSLVVRLRSESAGAGGVGGIRPGLGGASQPGAIDEAKLYVGYLPPSMNDEGLK